MIDNVGMHCLVSGRVQGVWFRASTQDEARRLGLTGWARNLPDGRVEVMAFGEKEKIRQLHEWLKKGPKLAEVKEVTFEEIKMEQHERFAIK